MIPEVRFALHVYFTTWRKMFNGFRDVMPLHRLPGASARPSFVEMVGALCGRTPAKLSFRLSCVFCAALAYADRLNLRLAHLDEGEKVEHFRHISGLDERERWLLCHYLADKLSLDVTHCVSAASFHRALSSLKEHKIAVEFELLDLLGWRLEEPDMNPIHLLNILVALSGHARTLLVPSSAPLNWPQLALRLCLLSAYDARFSTTNLNPTALAVACFAIAAAAAGLDPWPLSLVTHLPYLPLRRQHLFEAVATLLHLWDSVLDMLEAPLPATSELASCDAQGRPAPEAMARFWRQQKWLRQNVLPPGSLHFRNQTSVRADQLVAYFISNHS